MAYKLYMAGTLMPITPSKVTVKINSQNKTMTLINGEEINILKAAGLSDVSLNWFFPKCPIPSAMVERKAPPITCPCLNG